MEDVPEPPSPSTAGHGSDLTARQRGKQPVRDTDHLPAMTHTASSAAVSLSDTHGRQVRLRLHQLYQARRLVYTMDLAGCTNAQTLFDKIARSRPFRSVIRRADRIDILLVSFSAGEDADILSVDKSDASFDEPGSTLVVKADIEMARN